MRIEEGKRYILAVLISILLMLTASASAAMPVDLSAVRPGPIAVSSDSDSLAVNWSDSDGGAWRAVFSLDPSKPLITSVGTGGKIVIDRARPYYKVQTGKRRGGWDAFFDFPPSHPEGTRSFQAEFKMTSASARTEGDRVIVAFQGLRMGIFEGALEYVFYPGSKLIAQRAVATTNEPDVAYFFDAGIRMTADSDRRAGNNMESYVSYYDTEGKFQTAASRGSDLQPVAVRYRAIAAKMANGSVVVFPPPHQYFFARDYTTNMAQAWHSAWRGTVAIGVRQLPDDNSPYYPWMNAPPGSVQKMTMFLYVDSRPPGAALDDVLRYTRRDKFARLAGFKTVAPHWHYAYTVQAMDKGFQWVPPFKPVLKAMGVDAAIIMDFHGDGHPFDTTDLRLRELDAFFKACRTQSDKDFLLIPSEEANVQLGGHWAVVFPMPVYWFMKREPQEPFLSKHPPFGNVYRIGNERDMLELVRKENGFVYQTHPRTKGSTGFPDKIRGTDHFRDPHYFGAGWKAMPSDLSSPREGERSLKLLDDMNNWGLRKNIWGEVDVFQLDGTHELWAHMNVNYVKMPSLPSFDRFGDVLAPIARGEFFVTTGEVLLPKTNVHAGAGDKIVAEFDVQHTFPLEIAEIVWGDGSNTYREVFPLQKTREFQKASYRFETEAKGWKWARVAVWDVAANGAFVNPVWR